MRKVILAVGVSLDSYIARPDGSVDFLFMPKDYSMAGLIDRVDTAIMGRKTYEVALRMGGSWGKIKPYVMSQTLHPGIRDGVEFVNDSPVELVNKLRARPGKHIWHMGGGELARAFLNDDLIDEIELGMVPVILGEGIPVFPPGSPQRNFRLVANKTYSRGLVVLTYRRTRAKP